MTMPERLAGIHKSRDPKGEPIEYTIEIDWFRMNRLAQKAAHNKSRKAKAGPITVHHTGPEPK